MAKTFNLSVVFEIVNKATAPIKKVARQMNKLGGPINKVKKAMNSFGRAAIKSLRKIGAAARRVGARMRSMGNKMAVGLAAAGAGAILMIKRITALSDVIGKTADRIGITTDELQKLRFAGEQTGLTTQEMDKSMEQFNRRLGEAQDGTGEAYDALKKLKIGLKDSNGQMKPMTQILGEVADKTAAMNDKMAKADILYGLFGRSGVKMVNTLKGGKKGLKEFGDQLDAKGGIIPEETIRQSEAFNDAINLLKKSVQGFISTALIPLLPRLTEIVDKMTDWIGENKELIKGFGETVKMLLDMAVAVAKVAGFIGKFLGESAAKVVGGIESAGSERSKQQAIIEANQMFSLEKQQTEIKIKVASDKDSIATVEGVANIVGNPNVNIATEAFVGAF